MTNRTYYTALEQLAQCYSYACSYRHGVVAYDDENIIIGRMVEYWLDHQHDDNMNELRAAMNGSDPITFFRFYLRVVLTYQFACYAGNADRAYNATFIIPKVVILS
jgi:hypothetical protein